MDREITYKEVKGIETPNFKVRVYRPELTDEERAFRMRQIEQAVINMLTRK